MRFAFSTAESPPCLFVPAVISSIGGPRVHDADAKVDTGADVTTVPIAVCHALGLVPFNHVTVRGALAENWTLVPMYQIRLRLAGSSWIDALAVGSPGPYMTLGRDILNRFILTANGPARWFELELPV